MFAYTVWTLAHPQIPPKIEMVPRDVAAYLVHELEGKKGVLFIGEFNAVPAHLIAWELRKRGDRVPVYQSMDYKEPLEGMTPFAPGSSDRTNLLRLVTVARELSVDTVVTIGLKKISPFYDWEYIAFNEWKQKYVDQLESMEEFRKMVSREFDPAGVSVAVYGTN